MQQVRSQLWRRAETRCLVRDVWIGNATVETCLSLLPAPLYRSRRCRWALHILLDYFLPAYTVLQGLGNLLPFAGRQAAALLAMLRGDVGVRIVLAVLRMYRQVWLLSALLLLTHLVSMLLLLVLQERSSIANTSAGTATHLYCYYSCQLVIAERSV
jgi:hypothetical protein